MIREGEIPDFLEDAAGEWGVSPPVQPSEL